MAEQHWHASVLRQSLAAWTAQSSKQRALACQSRDADTLHRAQTLRHRLRCWRGATYSAQQHLMSAVAHAKQASLRRCMLRLQALRAYRQAQTIAAQRHHVVSRLYQLWTAWQQQLAAADEARQAAQQHHLHRMLRHAWQAWLAARANAAAPAETNAAAASVRAPPVALQPRHSADAPVAGVVPQEQVLADAGVPLLTMSTDRLEAKSTDSSAYTGARQEADERTALAQRSHWLQLSVLQAWREHSLTSKMVRHVLAC